MIESIQGAEQNAPRSMNGMLGFHRKSPTAMRVQLEDALKHLLNCDESGRGATVDSLAGALAKSQRRAAEILGQMRGRNLATAAGDTHHLTEDGRLYALQVVRTHRLYETWLARETSTPPAEWHRAAHKAEHHPEAADVDALANSLNNPRFDPHGDPIPTREGRMPNRPLTSLASWPNDRAARIEHVADEPEALYRQAEALGLAPGAHLDRFRHVEDSDFVVALAGNPNTGKTTVFNALTGLRMHTGNWPGKTISRAEGGFSYEKKRFKLVDLPGTYSLLSASPDEEVARSFLLFGQPDVTIIVADSTCMERNLNLVLQVLQVLQITRLPQARWVALRLLEGDREIIDAVRTGEIGTLADHVNANFNQSA